MKTNLSLIARWRRSVAAHPFLHVFGAWLLGASLITALWASSLLWPKANLYKRVPFALLSPLPWTAFFWTLALLATPGRHRRMPELWAMGAWALGIVGMRTLSGHGPSWTGWIAYAVAGGIWGTPALGLCRLACVLIRRFVPSPLSATG